jgi:hypothetical protein
MDNQFKKYLKLAETYKILLLELFDFAYSKNIMPMKFNLFYDKDKISNLFEENKITAIQYGIDYFLEFKNEIENFSLSELKSNENIFILNKIKNDLLKTNNVYNEQLIDMLFGIINNSKFLNTNDFNIIKEYLLTILLTLNKLKCLLT